jgi:hypothetical protein
VVEAHQAQVCGLRALELLLVRAVVRVHFRGRDRDGAVGDHVARDDRGERDLHLLVLVAIALPQCRVREDDVGGDDAEQLVSKQDVAVLLADGVHVRGGGAGRQPPLVLRHVELAVGLELRCLLQLGRGVVADRVGDLILAHGQAVLAVLRLEEAGGEELLPDLIADLLLAFQRQRRGGGPLLLLGDLLDAGLVGLGRDRVAVDLPDGAAA